MKRLNQFLLKKIHFQGGVFSLIGLRVIVKGTKTLCLQRETTIINTRRPIFLLGFMLMLTASLYGQTTVTTINVSTAAAPNTTTNVTSPSDAGNAIADNTNYNVNYGVGNDVAVTSYVVSGTTYDRFLSPDTLLLRRTSSSRLVNIWYQLNQINTLPDPDDLDLDPSIVAEADAIYLSGNLNAGYDNILVNEDDLATGSIEVETERVDVIWYSGIQTSDPTTAVFPVIERGGNDNIIIAPITSLDSNGDPATYGTAIGIGETDWPGTGQTYTAYLILRRETVGVDPIPLLNIGSQVVQGMAVSFSEMGISANQSIFGYSLFPADVANGYVSGTDLTSGAITVAGGVDLTDISTFPTTTLSSDSGLDLVAGVSAAVASDDNLVETKGPGGYKAALSTWLKANEAADVTTSTDASTVTDWQDHWTGNHDATTGVAAPTYRSTSSAINFNPTVDFTSASTSLTIANNSDFNTATSYTNKGINLAFRTNTTDITDRQVIYEQGGNTRGIIVYIRAGNLHVSSWNRNNDGTGSPWNNSTNISTVSTSISANTEYIVTLELAGTSGVSGTLTPYLNGQSFGSLSSIGLLFSDTDGIEFGGSDGSTQFDDGTNAATNSFEGEISELIYCNEPAAFSVAQRQRIESYLAIKYGITLDQSTPINYVNSDGTVIFDATNNAAVGGYLEYNNDIAGIGRDDAAELDQPASRSENTGSIVTIDRGATISTDDAWLIWGNDGAALTETALLTMPDTIDMRLNRVWRVAEKDEVLTTSVSFDLTGLGLSTNQNDFSLLIASNSSNADFSSATVLSGGTLVGSVLTFTGVDLEDGQYFTLGTDFETCAPGGVETDLALWYEADSEAFNTGTTVATDGQTIASWNDQSQVGNNGTEANGGGTPQPPTFQATGSNFNPTIRFTDPGTTAYSFITSASRPAQDDMTLISVFSTTQTDAGGQHWNSPAILGADHGATGANYALGHRNGQVLAKIENGDGVGAQSAGTFNDGITRIATATRVVSGNTVLYMNSASTATDASDGTSLTAPDAIGVGNHESSSTASQFAGDISEVIVFADDLTSDEQNRVETYLAIKYGITRNAADDGTTGSVDERDYRDSDGNVIWDFTDQSSGYNNDIAGIGRDDAQCFVQKQSSSINTDGIVTQGLGGIAADNASNANNFATDGSFQVWGNDNAATAQASANTVDVPGIVTERMERIWHVQETGTVGPTTLTFDITGLGYSTNASDFNLITSSSSTMASGTITPAASLVGNLLTFTNVDFSDGDFFTIGTARTSCGPGGITANLALWLRADVGTNTTTNGAAISSWSDQSATGNNYSQGTGSSQPVYNSNSINFNPALTFDGADDLGGSDNTYNDGIAFVTINGQDNGSNSILLDNDSYSLRYEQFNNTGSLGYTRYGISDNTSSITTPFGSPSIISFEKASASSSYSIQELSNGVRTTNSLSVGSTTAPIPTRDLGELVLGDIPEVIVFSSVLGSTDEAKVKTYLALKYGIQKEDVDDGTTGSVDERDYLSSSTTAIWDYSANSSYNNDIAGIGRDDSGCFTQKQSSSVNTDDILAVGLTSVEATNAENLNSFTDDGDFLIWGNDNGTTVQASANTVDVPNAVSERMSRIWKVQDTGTVGETELQFDLTGLGYSVADAAAFSLLVGNTATMATATVISGGTLNGNILSFTGVDLTDGQFFTIGTALTTCGPGGVNTDIALWLRADLQVFSDAGVTAAVDGNNALQWNDQSSPADNGSETDLGGAGPIEPTFETNEMNFNPVLTYVDPNSSNSSYIETTTNTVSGDMTLISVFETGQADGVANDFVNSPAFIGASETTGTLDYGMGMENGSIWVNANTTTTFDAETAGSFNDIEPHIATATRVQSSGAITIYVDGASSATGTGSTSALTDPTSFGVGNHSDGDQQAQFSGNMAEVIVFSDDLTSDERNRVETYLSLKYGITMNSADDGATGSVDERDYRAGDGGVVWDFSDKSAYTNDIFGIGRDDLSCLTQTQSKSENDDALVTINLPGGFSTDDSWLVSGNDNAPIEAPNNQERPATINSRLNREWQVQETGTVGTIQLTYDLSTVTGTAAGTNNLNLTRLLVDDDGDFTTGATLISPTSIDGGNNTVTFEVNFTDGQYYTLGSIEDDALPITLVSFEVNTYKDDQVKLDWTTASETNNSFYTVERSTDGQNFETVANIDGAGNSDNILFYSHVDVNPLNGLSFYRLKQTDFNGEFDYSEIKSVRIEKQFTATYKAYPNPIVKGGKLRIAYSIDRDQALNMSFLNSRGQVVHREAHQASIKNQFIEVSTDMLDRGLNLIRILDENGNVATLKVIIR